MTDAEARRILVEWNNTSATYPGDRCIHHLFEARAAQHPENIAVAGNGGGVTYRQLNARAEQIAAQLNFAGVRCGCLVGIHMERSADLIAALLGILKAGGAYVPIDGQWPEARMVQVAAASRLTHWVTQDSLMATARRVQAELPDLQTVVCPSEKSVRVFGTAKTPLPGAAGASSDDLAYVIFTSGSSGEPKGVAVKHRPVVNVIDWVNKTFGVGTGDRLLFVTSVAFDLSVYDIFGVLAAGATIRIASDEELHDPKELLRILREEGITFWDSAPAALQQMVPAMEADAAKSESLRLVFLSGDWIPLALPDTVKKSFPRATVVGLGGATEAAIWSNYHVIEEVLPSWSSIPYGRPIQNARYYILDERLGPCAVGVAGRLFIGGECLACGYANEPELTARKFVADPFSPRPEARMYDTGDLAKYWPDGTIEFLGRADQQVKIRGFRVELGEIEAALQSHPGVRQAVAVAHESSGRDRQLAGYVVPRGLGTRLSPAELRSHLGRLLPQYMVPPALVVLEQIPLTPNGKVDRRALPNPWLERANPLIGYEAPATEMERRIAAIWQKVLTARPHPIGRRDNFFELGGDSLRSVEAAAAAAAAGLQISSQQMFQYPTIAQLAEVAQPLRPKQGTSKSDGREMPAALPLTPIQHWLFERNLRDPENYSIALLLDVDRQADSERLLAAIRNVASRHDAFKLRFEKIDGRWRQRLAEVAMQCDTLDLSGLAANARDAAMRAALVELRRGLDLAHGPLFKVVLFDLGETRKLGLVAHHLIFDGASLRIWLGHVQAAYEHEDASESFDYGHWAQSLAVFARTSAAESYLEKWLALPWEHVRPLPLDFPDGRNTYRSSAIVQETLDAQDTRLLLQEASRVYGASTGEVLLAAWGRAMAGWANAEAVLVDMTGHGRERFPEDVDVSGIIGYVTANSPAVLHAAHEIPTPRPPEQSWGILRCLSDSRIAERLKALPVPQVKFNYQGMVERDSAGGVLRGPLAFQIPGTMHPDNPRAYLFNIELMVLGGHLNCQCVYSRELHRQARIEALLGSFLGELHQAAGRIRDEALALAPAGART